MILDDTYLPPGSFAPAAEPDFLQLGAFEPRSMVAGPGARAVVWVSGCLRRCPGCMKPDLFSFEAGQRVAVVRVAEAILAIEGIEGVTFSGGEPFEQAAPLATLARLVKAAGLTVLVYSGYRLETLRRESHRFDCLLAEVDWLIDGEYRHELPGPFPWRGSANQQFVALSPQREQPVSEQPTREIQASITDNFVRLSGFPSPAVEQDLRRRLQERGILMTPCAIQEPSL